LRSFRFLVAAVFTAGLLACGAGVPDPGPPGGEPEPDGGQTAAVADLELGTGINGFEALAEDQTVDIIFGPQGGYHIWAALRARRARVAPDRVEVHARLFKDGAELSDNAYRLNLYEAGEYYEWYALQALVPDPVAIDGQLVTIRLELLDTNGVFASDERRVLARRKN
jgi:hypothetical protein